MIACLDVGYRERQALAAAVVVQHWGDDLPLLERCVEVADVPDYRPGEFFRRELPCLMTILKHLPPLETIVVDGYVWLDAAGRPGLGAHLYEASGGTTAVVGVAKNPFGTMRHAVEVCRGDSRRPLHVTAVGLPVDVAADRIASMHGPFRIPTVLKRADSLSRG